VTHQTARFVLDANVLDDIAGTASKLQACGLDALLLGIATESFPGGVALLRQGAERVHEETRLPVFAPTFAVFEALRALGAENVSLVTPFDAATNEHVAAAFREEGFGVLGLVGLARPGFDQIADTPPDEIRDAFARADDPEAQALVQVGTGLPVVSLLGEIEHQHGKPVVASNPALYWQALRGLGRTGALGPGRLLSQH